MSYGHVCNHKGLMLCVMLPNFNRRLKPTLTLSTTLNDLSQDGATNQQRSCYNNFLSHSLSLPFPLSFSYRQTHVRTHTHTHIYTNTHTHTQSDRDTHTHVG